MRKNDRTSDRIPSHSVPTHPFRKKSVCMYEKWKLLKSGSFHTFSFANRGSKNCATSVKILKRLKRYKGGYAFWEATTEKLKRRAKKKRDACAEHRSASFMVRQPTQVESILHPILKDVQQDTLCLYVTSRATSTAATSPRRIVPDPDGQVVFSFNDLHDCRRMVPHGRVRRHPGDMTK